MKKIITLILLTLVTSTAYGKQLDTITLTPLQKTSVAYIQGMSREECYNYIDTSFHKLPLINYFKSQSVQEKTYKQCLKRNVPYSIALITFYKESTYHEDAYRQYADGAVDVGIAQIHIKAENIEKKKYLIEKPMLNIYEGIYHIYQIMERYQAYTLLEINIAYQYGFERLYEARNGTPVPKAKAFLDRLEDSERYIEKMIKRMLIDKVINGEIVFRNQENQNIVLPKTIEY